MNAVVEIYRRAAADFADRLPVAISRAVLCLPGDGSFMEPININHRLALEVTLEAFDGELVERVNNSDFFYLRPFGLNVREILEARENTHETNND